MTKKQTMFRYRTSFWLRCDIASLASARTYLQNRPMETVLEQDIQERYGSDIRVHSVQWGLNTRRDGHVTIDVDRELSIRELCMIARWIRAQNAEGFGRRFDRQYFVERFDEGARAYVGAGYSASFDWQRNPYYLDFVGEVDYGQ